MPCLIPEILFAISKTFVQEKDSDAALKFAMSGKEPFKAIKNVFASITTLKIFINTDEIGWENECLNFTKDWFPNFLLKQIGNSVRSLHVNCKFSTTDEIYQFIIDKIIFKKQLNRFSAGPSCSTIFLNEFLPHFALTLRHIEIPSKLLSPIFYDTFKLDSLIISNPSDHNFAKFCCKTSSVKFFYYDSCKSFFPDFQYFEQAKISPHLSLVKELIVDHSELTFLIDNFESFIKYFPSLEIIKCDITNDYYPREIYDYQFYIRDFTNIINVPSKILCSFYKRSPKTLSFTLDELKKICENFGCDESDVGFYCFRQTIQSADKKSVFLEIQFSK